MKRENTLLAYQSLDESNAIIENYNFVPNDGITTTLVLPMNVKDSQNYALVCNEDDEIESRWFIMESVRTRDGQFRVTLQRDVLADKLESFQDSPMFVEKATLGDNDPLIYNSEDLQVNQMKVNEILIRDQSRVPWLVAYMLRKTAVIETYEETIEFQGQKETKKYTKFSGSDPIRINIPQKRDIANDYTTHDVPMYPSFEPSSPDDVRLSGFNGEPVFNFDKVCYVIRHYLNNEVNYDVIKPSDDGFFRICRYRFSGGLFDSGLHRTAQSEGYVELDSQSLYKLLTNTMNTGMRMQMQLSQTQKLYGLPVLAKRLATDPSYLGKINKDIVSDEYYYMNPKKYTDYKSVRDFDELPYGEITNLNDVGVVFDVYFSSIYNALEIEKPDAFAIAAIPGDPRFGDKKCEIHASVEYCSFKHINATASQNFYIDVNTIGTQLNHARCEDACFDIVYLPYFDGDMAITDESTSTTVYISMTKPLAMEIMQRIKTCCGDNCVDVQIVPFCPDKPINKWSVTDDGSGGEKVLAASFDSIESLIPMFDDDSSDSLAKYLDSYLGGIGNATGMAFWSKACSNSFSTSEIYNDYDAEGPSSQTVEEVFADSDSKKTSNQCNFCRLVSPNYNGQFEFKPAKIGRIIKLDIDYMYMPYTPYIKVSPNFGGLYGTHNFNGRNDATGLICNGSFSIPQYDDKWADYCIQNKNYQNVFDREVKNMEVTNLLTNVDKMVKFGAGLTGSVASGNPLKAATTAVSGISGIATTMIGQAEALDFKKDLFAMNLENIQALPYSLSNVGVFNNNNKIFPFIEFYTCTVEEKEAFENKIKYNGMTVGRIGKLSDYLPIEPSYTYVVPNEYNYIKGKLIRFDGITEDNHFIQYLADEMDKGAYFRRTY